MVQFPKTDEGEPLPHYTTSYSTKSKKPSHRRKQNGKLGPTPRRVSHKPGAQYLRHTQGFGRHNRGVRNRHTEERRPYAIIIVACAALLFIASIIWYVNRGVDVTLNGSTVSVRIHSSIQQLIEDQDIQTSAGDLLAVDDSVLEKHAAEQYSVVLNGEQIDNADLANIELTGGEELEIGDGRDEYEEHDVTPTEIQPTLTIKGTGAIRYVETWGIPGRTEVWTGKVSGITFDRGVVQEVQNCVVRASSVSPTEGDYVALTFDEGPSSYTEDILKILAGTGSKATFFLQGDQVEKNQAAAQAIVESGNEVGSNSYANQDLSELSADDLRQQLTAGFDAISAATGSPCALLRPPYGLFDETCWSEAMDLVSAVVTWNLDSGDYLLNGADAVVENVMGSVRNGNIILLSDNDACGEQTLEALPKLIEQLQAEGYRLVTLSELIATDEELAESIDLSQVSMPEDAALPQPALQIDEEDEA